MSVDFDEDPVHSFWSTSNGPLRHLPKVSSNGESPVVVCGVSRYANRINGSALCQGPLFSVMYVLSNACLEGTVELLNHTICLRVVG